MAAALPPDDLLPGECGFCRLVCEILKEPEPEGDCRDTLRKLKTGQTTQEQVIARFKVRYGDEWALKVAKALREVDTVAGE